MCDRRNVDQSDRLDQVLDLIMRIAAGDLDIRRQPSSANDKIDSIIIGMNMLAEELSATMITKTFLTALLDSMINAVIAIDASGSILTVNPATCALLGYEEHELLDQPIWGMFPNGQGPFLAPGTLALIEKRRQYTGEVLCRRKNGEPIPVLCAVSLIQTDDTVKPQMVFVAQDLTERRKADQALKDYTSQLEGINRELDEFTYIVSHDLKEPLRSIDAFSRFLYEDYRTQLDAEGQEYLERIRANALRTGDLIRNLLDISRLARRDNILEDVHIAQLINEVRLRFEYAFEKQEIELVIPDTLPTIVCDRIRMGEVFANLISNAIKYADKTPCRIEVSCEDTDKHYQFSVADNGPGIAPQYFEKIFQIFHRLVRREDHEGTGVGLTIIKKIVEMHRGKIWVTSTLGQGATFHFTIPKNLSELENEPRLGEILLSKGLVTQQDLEEALNEQVTKGDVSEA